MDQASPAAKALATMLCVDQKDSDDAWRAALRDPARAFAPAAKVVRLLRSEKYAFNHVYLPTFIRSFRASLQVPYEQSMHVIVHLSLLSAITRMGNFARFMTESDDAEGLFGDTVDYLDKVMRTGPPKEIYEGHAVDDLARDWDNFFFDLSRALLYMIVHASSSPPNRCSSLLSHSNPRNALTMFAGRKEAIDRPVYADAAAELFSDVTKSFEPVIAFLEKKKTAKEVKLELVKSGQWVVWACCECEGQEHGPCEETKEMLACGKCRALTYCSLTHQKKDRKSHKLVCRDPLW